MPEESPYPETRLEPEICKIEIVVNKQGIPTMKVAGECAEKIEERLLWEEKVWLPSLEKREWKWQEATYEREMEKSKRLIAQLKEMQAILQSVKRFPQKQEEELEM